MIKFDEQIINILVMHFQCRSILIKHELIFGKQYLRHNQRQYKRENVIQALEFNIFLDGNRGGV